MEKTYTHIIIIIVFLIGLFFGYSGTKNRVDKIRQNLDNATSTIESLEGTISDNIRTVDNLTSELERERERYREQADFIDKIKTGFTDSGRTIKDIEDSNIRGQGIIKSILKTIDNQ